jgi:hypothetical protein
VLVRNKNIKRKKIVLGKEDVMKRLGMLLLTVVVLGWALPYNVDPVDPTVVTSRPRVNNSNDYDGVIIDSVGNIRAVLGSQGKSIAISGGGEAIAVLYGEPSGDPNNSMLVKVAYSLDGGATWTLYGPFTGASRRIYNDIAASPDFDVNPGELFFLFQENTQGYTDGQINVMIEENLPSAPSFSVPIVPTNASAPAMYPWEPSICVAPDDPTYVVATGWNYLTNGNEWQYVWISNDGGYSWSDSIPVDHISPDGSCAAMTIGPGGWMGMTTQEYYVFSGSDSTPYPYFRESTDGGNTWSAKAPITVFPANISSQYWWHEMDILYFDGDIWMIHNDIGVGGTGGPHVAKATGSPGSWTWTLWSQDIVGSDSFWVADTLYYAAASQYPTLSVDPVTGAVAAVCKYNYYVGDNVTWATYNGAHLGAMYTFDGGANWTVSNPLSAANTGTIIWGDWNATEAADLLEPNGAHPYVHAVWVHEDPATEAGELYHEREMLASFPYGVEEVTTGLVSVYGFSVTPSVTSGICRAAFTMPASGNVALKVFDVSGRLVEKVFSGSAAGEQEFNINTSQLANGAYFVVLETDQGNVAQKVITLH